MSKKTTKIVAIVLTLIMIGATIGSILLYFV